MRESSITNLSSGTGQLRPAGPLEAVLRDELRRLQGSTRALSPAEHRDLENRIAHLTTALHALQRHPARS